MADQLSVRAVEEVVREPQRARRSHRARLPRPVAERVQRSPQVRTRPSVDHGSAVHALEEMLSEFLDTRVKIELGVRKSRLNVEFADLDDLERIYRRMTSSRCKPGG